MTPAMKSEKQENADAAIDFFVSFQEWHDAVMDLLVITDREADRKILLAEFRKVRDAKWQSLADQHEYHKITELVGGSK